MKTTGIVLIALQVIAYLSGNFKMPNGPFSSTIGYLLGFNIFIIFGIIFIIQSNRTGEKLKENNNTITTSENKQTK